MPAFGYIEYEDATPEVKTVYDDIMRTRNVDWISNFWKSIAHDPGLLRRTWETLKDIMRPDGALDPLTKEMLYLAVSASNQCHYCIASHTAAAWKAGMNAAMFGELMAIVGMANETNRLVSGYQVEIDERFQVREQGWKQYPDPRDVVRACVRAFRSGAVDQVRELLDPDGKVFDGGQRLAIADLGAHLSAMRGSFGELDMAIETTTLANGEWVSMIIHTTARRHGAFPGVAAAGSTLSVPGMLMSRVVKGRILELHMQPGTEGLAQRLAKPQ